MSTTPRVRGLLVWLALVVAVVVAVLADARARRHAAATGVATRVAVARTLGLPDLALSSTSRWLRHPSQVEPGAPFADAPASLDTDPAGAVIGPPRRLLGAGARAIGVRRGGTDP